MATHSSILAWRILWTEDPGRLQYTGSCCQTRLNDFHFPGGSDSKESACNVGDPGLIPGSGRSPGEEYGNLLQHSCLENSWTEEPGRLQSMESQTVRDD